MSNSKLVSYTKISPNSTNPRNHKIDKITIHHMAGNLSVETCANVFQGSRQASSNYGVGTDGRVALYVDEANRAWTSSNRANDMRAVTIEVANDGGAPDWHVSDKALEATIALCVDICQRNGIPALNFTGDTSGNLTMHKWFAATSCPGLYLESKFPYIAQEVNRRLSGAQAEPEKEEKEPASSTLYRVQVGAYSKKANADKQLEKVKAAGFDACMVQVDGLYKIQTGAYSKKANAEAQLAKMKAAGFAAFITTKSGAVEATTEKKNNTEETKEVCDVKLPVLKKGSEGASVKALQTLLIGYGYSCGSAGVDGDFGSATDAAVRAYQKAKGLTVDGSCGPETWASLLGA